MTRRKELTTHLFRLVHIARSAAMKRALTEIDPNPHLNFWRIIHGNQLDIAVLEWCKVFGTDGEATHWKKIVLPDDHDQFRNNLFGAVGVSGDEWAIYRAEMKAYRDNLVAHHIELKAIANYPVLEIAIKSSCFYYSRLIKELRSIGETRYSDDLYAYSEAFEIQAREIASAAVAAVAAFKERVY